MRLIDADALSESIKSGSGTELQKFFADVCVATAPTVEAIPVRCRIGDTVWVVGTKCLSGLYEEECQSKNCWNDACDTCPFDREYIVFPRTVCRYIFADIHELDPADQNILFIWGETVFKTKEEAEAALAKMKGGAENA